MLIVCNVSAKGNKTGKNAEVHIQVKGLGYPSKQEVNSWNQHRRQERPSNAIAVQFVMRTF